MTNDQATTKPPGLRLSTAVLFVLGLLVAAAVGAGITTWLKERSDALSVRSTNTVVLAVRRLARLETAQLQLQQVVDLRDKQEHLWGLFESEDAILLIASGNVVAGVDLGQLGEGQVQVDEDRRGVRVALPKAQIFSVTLDNEHTFVHTRSTELLAKRNEQLEAKARRHAEDIFRKSALDADVLERASRNAEQTLRALLQSLGFERIAITGAGS